MTRTRSITFLGGAAALALIALAVGGCGGGYGGAPVATAPPTAVSGQAAAIGTADVGDLGTILVDSHGRTLYLFQKDSGTTSACFGACARSWPPLRVDGMPTAAGGADASLIGTTARSDRKPQVTYNRHPLYLYSGDQAAGEANGQGSTAFGGSWYALSVAGDRVSGQASSSIGYGGGY